MKWRMKWIERMENEHLKTKIDRLQYSRIVRKSRMRWYHHFCWMPNALRTSGICMRNCVAEKNKTELIAVTSFSSGNGWVKQSELNSQPKPKWGFADIYVLHAKENHTHTLTFSELPGWRHTF